jgi:hypothetical protein
MEALWGCASQLWVPGRICVHGRLHLSFRPITLQHFNFSLSKHADVCRNKKEQFGTLFVMDGGRGGGPSGRSRPKFTRDVQQFFLPSCINNYLFCFIGFVIYTFVLELINALSFFLPLSSFFPSPLYSVVGILSIP